MLKYMDYVEILKNKIGEYVEAGNDVEHLRSTNRKLYDNCVRAIRHYREETGENRTIGELLADVGFPYAKENKYKRNRTPEERAEAYANKVAQYLERHEKRSKFKSEALRDFIYSGLPDDEDDYPEIHEIEDALGEYTRNKKEYDDDEETYIEGPGAQDF